MKKSLWRYAVDIIYDVKTIISGLAIIATAAVYGYSFVEGKDFTLDYIKEEFAGWFSFIGYAFLLSILAIYAIYGLIKLIRWSMKKLNIKLFALLAIVGLMSSCVSAQKQETKRKEAKLDKQYESAIFADACFWCVEYAYEGLEGVKEVLSGYAGGEMKKPTYRNHGNHAEAVKVYYDPNVISYRQLVDFYFTGHSRGMSPDRGPSYRAVVFPDGEDQNEAVARRMSAETVKFKQQVLNKDDANWHVAEDYHQDYVKRNPKQGYVLHESIPRAKRYWSLTDLPKKKDWKKELDDEEYYIMVKSGTERPFSSPLNSEKRSGVYVSAATGDVLFRSSDKFNSGTGWPSFHSATSAVDLGPAEQGGYEVIEKSTGHHLGHLFLNEGFTNENKRYCINGDALEFIPDENP